MKKIHYTTEQIVEALKKVQAGTHPSDVEKEMQIKPGVVAFWCRKVGLKYERKQGFVFRDWDAIREALGIKNEA